MIIKLEPDLRGMCSQAELVYDVQEAAPFRVTITTSHQCVAQDLFELAKAVGELLVPAQLVRSGRLS